MRESTAGFCEAKHHQGTAAGSRLAPAYAAPLALPTLDSIPPKLTTVNGAQVSARMALTLMQLGLLTYRDWARPWQHENDLIERALQKWLRKATRELQMFQFGIAYSDQRAENLSNHFGYVRGVAENVNNIAFTLYRNGSLPEYTLCYGLIELETTVTGLGETAMHFLNQAMFHTVPMLTPLFALWCAQEAHWMGEEDESLYIEEYLNEEDINIDDIVYRKGDFLANVPEWAAEPKQRLTQSSLRQIALGMPGTDAGTVAELLLKIARGCKGTWNPHTRDEDMDCTEISAIFRWSETDDCTRLFDDSINGIYNTGEDSTDDFGSAFMLPLPAPVKAWMRSAEKTFRLLRHCEQLVRMVGKPVH